MENLINFNVTGEVDDSMGAVSIAGVPLVAGTPANGQVLRYRSLFNRWHFEHLPVVTVLSATGIGNVVPVAGVDIDMPTDLLVTGTDIVHSTPSTFTLSPGIYRLQFSFRKATFDAAGTTEFISYYFYNQTAASSFGPLGEVAGFAPGTTVVCGVSIETFVELLASTDISVRVSTVGGTSPTIVDPVINIERLE